eukprot:7543404-Pyramimonas_sp.AAC.1
MDGRSIAAGCYAEGRKAHLARRPSDWADGLTRSAPPTDATRHCPGCCTVSEYDGLALPRCSPAHSGVRISLGLCDCEGLAVL